jgi:hypothetical protein
MDDNERKEVFDRLVAILSQSGLGWIVEQVNEQIHNGKTELVEVETIKRREDTDLLIYDPGRPKPAVRRGPKARFSTTVDYNDKEKLALLLDGIAQATNALEMETEVLQQTKTIELGIGAEITFFSEASGETTVVLSPTRVTTRDPLMKDSLDAISKLREESNKD